MRNHFSNSGGKNEETVVAWPGRRVAGVCGTSYYAMMHPGSMVGQCVFKAGEFGLRVNPIVVLARGIANARHQEPVSTAPVEDALPG